MEQLSGGFTLEISPGAFPLGTDSIALAGFARLPRNAKALDLGSGCGTLGLLLCARHPDCAVTGVELDPQAHSTALENIRRNGLTARMESICADLRQIPQFLTPGSFSFCITNPPYFSSGPASKTLSQARREDSCDLQSLLRSAAWALKYGGDLCLVYRPERLAELFTLASQARLEPKRLCLVRHKPADPVSLVLVQCRKGAKPGLIWLEESLHHPNGEPTDYYRKLYHL
jgi:tRNA1(Val) A37 N6-methylase TrmN6